MNFKIMLIRLIMFLVLSALCYATPQSEQFNMTAFDYYLQGIQFTNSESWYKAARSYESSIKLDSTNQDAWYNLGIAYFQMGMYTKSIDAFKYAIKLKPDFHEAHNNLGMAYHRLKQYSLSKNHYRQSLELNADQAAAYRNLGTLLLETGEFTESIPILVTAISKYSQDAELYSGLGWALYNIGQYNNAVTAFRKSLEIRPKHVNTLYNLGLTYIELNQKKCATEIYDRLKKLDKITAESLNYLIQQMD